MRIWIMQDQLLTNLLSERNILAAELAVAVIALWRQLVARDKVLEAQTLVLQSLVSKVDMLMKILQESQEFHMKTTQALLVSLGEHLRCPFLEKQGSGSLEHQVHTRE